MKANPRNCECNGACKGDNRCKACTCETLVPDDKRQVTVTPIEDFRERA
jgi:hypothetical protein